MNQQQIPISVQLITGDEYILRLEGFGTAGYEWASMIVAGDDQTVAISESFDQLNEELHDDMPVGRSRNSIFTIRALKAGHIILCFILKRSWEKSVTEKHFIYFQID